MNLYTAIYAADTRNLTRISHPESWCSCRPARGLDRAIQSQCRCESNRGQPWLIALSPQVASAFPSLKGGFPTGTCSRLYRAALPFRPVRPAAHVSGISYQLDQNTFDPDRLWDVLPARGRALE